MNEATASWVIANAHRHGLPQIRLLKLLWLAELRHYERTGERLTNANWWRWDFGPYSKDVINTIKADAIHFKVEQTLSPVGRVMVVVQATEAPQMPTDDPRLQTLKDVLWMYRDCSNEEILAEVYSDPFFTETAYSDDFDFTKLASCREPVLSEKAAKYLIDLPTKPLEDVTDLWT